MTAGPDLAAYTRPCVSGEIKRHFHDRRWQVRVKRSTQEPRLELRRAGADLTQRLARAPSDAELADELRTGVADVAEARQADAAFQAASLDAPRADGTGTFLRQRIGEGDS